MSQPDRPETPRTTPSFLASFFVLAFGLGALAFLIAIERPHWFRLRPASGTAAAMWHAADNSQTQAEKL